MSVERLCGVAPTVTKAPLYGSPRSCFEPGGLWMRNEGVVGIIPRGNIYYLTTSCANLRASI